MRLCSEEHEKNARPGNPRRAFGEEPAKVLRAIVLLDGEVVWHPRLWRAVHVFNLTEQA